jgi:hypothetical protein
MMLQTEGSCGVCGLCGVSLKALTREKNVSWVKLYFFNIEVRNGNPQTPQPPQPAIPFPAFSLKIQTRRPSP